MTALNRRERTSTTVNYREQRSLAVSRKQAVSRPNVDLINPKSIAEGGFRDPL